MKKLFDINVDTKTEEEKIEILESMIKKNEKKIKFREEFIIFSTKWSIIHLVIPVLTLIITIVSCIIPIPGLIEAIFSYILFGWVFSIAIIEACLIIYITKLIMSKTVKKLKIEKDKMREIKEQLILSKSLNKEKLQQENDLNNLLNVEEKTKQNMQIPEFPVFFSQEIEYITNKNEKEQTENLCQEKSVLTKRLVPQENKKNSKNMKF